MKDVILVIMKEVQELSEILYFNEDNTYEVINDNHLSYSCNTIGIKKISFKNITLLKKSCWLNSK